MHCRVENDSDAEEEWEYECFRCHAALHKITPGDAIQKIIQQRPEPRRERKRNKEHQEASDGKDVTQSMGDPTGTF